ncbi:hypothetical protein ACFX2I_017453 [Malus domestica]
MRMIHRWLQFRRCSLEDDPTFFSSTYGAVINLNYGGCWRLSMQRSGDGAKLGTQQLIPALTKQIGIQERLTCKSQFPTAVMRIPHPNHHPSKSATASAEDDSDPTRPTMPGLYNLGLPVGVQK